MTTAKQRAWRAKFAQMYGGKKRSRSKRARVRTMVRRKGYRRSKGGSKIFGLSTKGLLSLGVLGAVAGAMFSDQIGAMIPVNVPFKNYGVAFAIGGPAGLAGKVVKDMFLGSGSNGAADSSGAGF